MSETIKAERHQTLGEEIANAISHGVGFLGALAATPVMIVTAIPSGAAAIVCHWDDVCFHWLGD